jgi:inner membrane protein
VFAWLGLAALLRRRDWVLPGVVLFGNLLLHLALDTVAGGVRWLAPFSDRSFVLATVPARHGWWVWNFLLGLDQDREAPAP